MVNKFDENLKRFVKNIDRILYINKECPELALEDTFTIYVLELLIKLPVQPELFVKFLWQYSIRI